MFPDFSEKLSMKIKYFSLKGGFPLNPPLIPVWFTDFLTTWAKPEVNRAAYDLYYENFDGLLSFWWVCKKLIKFLSILAFYLRQYSLLNLAYDRLHISTQNYT